MALEVLEHGRATILAHRIHDDEEILLAMIPPPEGMSFVTWKRRIDGPKEGTYMGHYFKELKEAYEDYSTR